MDVEVNTKVGLVAICFILERNCEQWMNRPINLTGAGVSISSEKGREGKERQGTGTVPSGVGPFNYIKDGIQLTYHKN